MKYYTYMHCRPDGTPFYFGKGSGVRAYKRGGRNTFWHRIVNKYGDRKVVILAKFDSENEAYEHEKFLINCFKSLGFILTNYSVGGDGPKGYIQTAEHRKNISKGRKGIQFSDTHKDRIKTSQQNRDWLCRTKPVSVLTADQKVLHFTTCKNAAEFFGVKPHTFRSWVRGRSKPTHPNIIQILPPLYANCV